MILTNRELFLLIICTVFYITLFILVIQNNRRKIQLLQSRLDNIHAMQKMAVIEQRQDVSTIFSSPVYLRIKKYLNEGKGLTDNVQSLPYERTGLSCKPTHKNTHPAQGHCHTYHSLQGEYSLHTKPPLSKGVWQERLDERLGRLCAVYLIETS